VRWDCRLDSLESIEATLDYKPVMLDCRLVTWVNIEVKWGYTPAMWENTAETWDCMQET
jgi:hypothetical protein